MKTPNDIKQLIAILCLALLSLNTQAQQHLPIEHITAEQGLSQGVILDILQDQEGFLWIGTKDGLNRYDGYQFKVFTNDPDDPWSISGNTINLLFEDSQGRIWAASENSGINIYDKETGRFHHIRHDPKEPSSLSGNYISSIVEDTSGYFVVAVSERDLNMFRLQDDFFLNQKPPSTIRVAIPTIDVVEKMPRTIVKGLVKDAKDRIWMGGKDVLYQLNVQEAKLTKAIDDYSLGTVFTNPDGSLWACGANQTLFHWDGVIANRFLKGFKGANDIRIDQKNNMWVVSSDSLFGIDISDWREEPANSRGLDRFFYKWGAHISTASSPLKSLTLDRSGLLWVGTNGYGLYKINPHHRRFVHKLPGVSVRQISIISEDKYFILNYSNEWYDPDGNTLLLDPLGMAPNTRIHDFLLVTQSGDYWIRQPLDRNMDCNIKIYNPKTKEDRHYEASWHHSHHQPMIECRDNTVWMAGYNDVLTGIDPSTDSIVYYNITDGRRKTDAFKEEKLVSYESSTALYEDKSGILWVGTERGLTKCIRPSVSGSPLQVFSYENIPGNSNSLSYNHITCFLDDPVNPDRYLWICTKGGGINRFDKINDNFLRLGKKDGLPDEVVYGILTDEAGNIWGSTNKGLFCMRTIVDKKTKEINYTFRNFSKADGLQDNEFNTGASAKFPDGRLAFGGINGYNIFDPAEVLSDTYTPRTFITSIAVNNQPVSPGDETGILQKTIETTESIILTHLQDILTIDFASLDYNVPERNKYRYQLIGVDDSWVEVGNQRSASFLHLPPDEYLFRVQGSNSQGIWSDQIAELNIRVLPPWWKTGWAYLAYILIMLAMIWTYVRFSINRDRLQQQLSFEKREADRIKDLDVLKTQLYMNMTHEFRTPLTIILGMAQQAKDQPKEHFHNGLELIIRNGQNLLGMVNKMLSLSKLENGKMNLELVQGDIILFLRNIVESFRSFASNKNIQLHFLPETDLLVMEYDPDKLQQVISNLLSNAFKFTPKNGNIYVGLRIENNQFVIRVKDTGRGILKKDIEKIFDRFYQVDQKTTRQYEGTGIGLALSKELVKLMKGKITAQSPPVGTKTGAEFKVILPIENVALKNLVNIPVRKPGITVSKDTATKESQPVIIDQNQPLILLVEDNADVVLYVSSCLSDYQLIVANNGQEGFDKAIATMPDLIISDVMMPIMDGFEMCQKIKSDQRTDHIPVVMLTARADLDSKLEGLQYGANAYLPKPFEKKELLLTLENLFSLRDKLKTHLQAVAGISEPENITTVQSKKPKPEDKFVIEVRNIIQEHLSDFNFTVEQLAGKMYLSHSQFGRKLDALIGISPNQLIRSIRLQKAKELLQDPALNITAIAYECGFNDPSYFSRVFKKEFGKTPGAWRKVYCS